MEIKDTLLALCKDDCVLWRASIAVNEIVKREAIFWDGAASVAAIGCVSCLCRCSTLYAQSQAFGRVVNGADQSHLDVFALLL